MDGKQSEELKSFLDKINQQVSKMELMVNTVDVKVDMVSKSVNSMSERMDSVELSVEDQNLLISGLNKEKKLILNIYRIKRKS